VICIFVNFLLQQNIEKVTCQFYHEKPKVSSKMFFRLANFSTWQKLFF